MALRIVKPVESATIAQFSDADLQRRREEIRRGLARANVAAVAILLIVIGLALTAVWQAQQSRRYAGEAKSSAQRAQAATARAEEELWTSRLAGARAGRLSGAQGQRL